MLSTCRLYVVDRAPCIAIYKHIETHQNTSEETQMASVRKRSWTTSKGEEKMAWIVDYQVRGKQHIKTFRTEKAADAWRATMEHEVSQGIHTPASASITVAEAGKLWIEQAETDGLEASTVMYYQQHLKYHIVPLLGDVKLSALSAASVQDFRNRLIREGRSAVMVRKVTSSLGAILAHAMTTGRVNLNPVHELT